MSGEQELTRKDFLSGTDPRWCPGCGCHSVYARLTSVMPKLGISRENFVMISGIGCSSRFPYYVNTYGMHSIHGRAPTIATGVKLNNPDLSVWVVTGDGDALAIGGNHFMHLMRRNADIKVLLFNNQIYGLTKGQASPTTKVGTKTKTTPLGSEEPPVRPLSLAIAAGATFAARVPDNDAELLSEVLLAAGKHRGVAFVEVLVNCVIYNDKTFAGYTDKIARAERTIRLEDGKPLLFGASGNKGIRLKDTKTEVVEVGKDAPLSDVLVHDVSNPDSTPAYLLSSMEHPDRPVSFGVFRKVDRPIYGDRKLPVTTEDDFRRLLRDPATTWTVDQSGLVKHSE